MSKSPILTLPQIPQNLEPELRDYLSNLTKIMMNNREQDFSDNEVVKSDIEVVNEYLYRPGSIIEYLTSPCDGSEVVGLSGTYTWPNVTTQQYLTTTYEDITGSSIAYTPPEGASKVLYRFLFKGLRDSERPRIHFMLMLDGSEIKEARTTIYSDLNEQQQSIEWVFDSWEGSKTIKLRGREYSSDYQGQLHNIMHWNGGVVSLFQPPILTIIAIA